MKVASYVNALSQTNSSNWYDVIAKSHAHTHTHTHTQVTISSILMWREMMRVNKTRSWEDLVTLDLTISSKDLTACTLRATQHREEKVSNCCLIPRYVAMVMYFLGNQFTNIR